MRVLFSSKTFSENFSPMASDWACELEEKSCLRCISDTMGCRMFVLGGDIGWGCRCALSWCVFELTFDHPVVTPTFKILPGLHLGNCRKVIAGRDIACG